MNKEYYQNNTASKKCDVWNIRTIVTFIVCIAIPLIVGAVSSFLTRNAMVSFNSMNKPPLAPPAWLFPVAWTILYIVMGIASFLIFKSEDKMHYLGMIIYAGQLVFNFVWSLLFFRLEAYGFAAVWLAVLILMIVALIFNTSKYSRWAMLMLIPYGLWCCFALYLNIGIAILN